MSDPDAASVVAAMKDVALRGLVAARHIVGDIYEVRAIGDRQTFRILFAPEGRKRQILLALHAFSKKKQKLERRHLDTAQRRLADWRGRGADSA